MPDLDTRHDLGTYELHDDIADLRYERRYDRPVETVWSALTEPERLADWLGQAVVEPKLGGRFDLFVDRKNATRGRVLAWQPPRLLEFSWEPADLPPSTVRCELTADGAGTRLVFTHKGLGFPWIGLVLPGWHAHLDWLGRLLDGKPAATPTGFPMDEWRALQKAYIERYRLDGVMLDPPPGHCE